MIKKVYPHYVPKVSLQGTYISDFSYRKICIQNKKELKFGKILDFSTLSLRRKFCQKEVDPNKILCPNIHEGVVSIVQENDSSVRIRDLDHHYHTKTLDYAVKMKEIPQKYRLDHRVCKNRIST